MTNEYSIAVLLPTRGRTDALTKSVVSIVENAANISQIQFIFGFDHDDTVGFTHFTDVIQPLLDQVGVTYEALGFNSLGYAGLNQYYNTLAKNASADWLFIWNDDAYMTTKEWDTVIASYTGEFKLLKLHTHNDHPYSIFPIVPNTWYDLLGYFSCHQMIDAELSQIAYMLDIIQIIDITAVHEQSELTGANDTTSKSKVRFEGDPKNPKNFHHISYGQQRVADSNKLADYMKSIDMDTTFWENVKAGKQDPWAKLVINDVNKQMTQSQSKVV